jgi:hypothetical protein
MEIKINIPEYLTVNQFQKINNLEHLSELEKIIQVIHILTKLDIEVISNWKPEQLKNINGILFDKLDLNNTTFYPIVEFNEVKYGFNPISKLTLGEYIDLERLCKNPVENLKLIMAILYRPITKDKTKSFKYSIKNGIKIAQGKADNLFNYYSVEKYNSNETKSNAEIFGGFPVSMALGALSFFLLIGSKSLSNMKEFSNQKMLKKMTEYHMNQLLTNIGDGFQQYIFYRNHPSLKSQETIVYLN